MRPGPLRTSLWLSASSLLLASISLVSGQQVNYLNHLSFFNAMALGMVSLSIAALLIGLIGTWQTQGRSVPLWLANMLTLVILGLYMFDS